jgi:hypothetical protein
MRRLLIMAIGLIMLTSACTPGQAVHYYSLFGYDISESDSVVIAEIATYEGITNIDGGRGIYERERKLNMPDRRYSFTMEEMYPIEETELIRSTTLPPLPHNMSYPVSGPYGPTCEIVHVDNWWTMWDVAQARDWTGHDWNAWVLLTSKESGGCETAQNRYSTAYGIGQFLNSTWASTGIAKTDDPAQQIEAMALYIEDRYGNPQGAWSHSQRRNWY